MTFGYSDVECQICREDFANVPDLWDHRDRKHPGWYEERLLRVRMSELADNVPNHG